VSGVGGIREDDIKARPLLTNGLDDHTIKSSNDTFNGQLNLEWNGGHTPPGVMGRVLRRVLALATAIWHNNHTGQPTKRSIVAYDHWTLAQPM
jgi:hypothetical protein